MKSLQNFIDQPLTELFDQNGMFYAFSDEQFQRQADPNTEYVHAGSGLICPKENIDAARNGITKIIEEGIQADKQSNTKEEIIFRELKNYEAFYTGCIEDTAEALEAYGYNEAEIWQVYKDKEEEYLARP